MGAIGMLVFLFGYTLLWWGIKQFGGQNPPSFTSLLFPFSNKSATS